MHIVTINYPLSGETVVNTTIDGDVTLLDADVIIANPQEFDCVWKKYAPDQKSIRSRVSDKVRHVFASRNDEIETLLTKGKIIVVFISPIKAVRAEIDNSGVFDYITNYDFIFMFRAFLIQHLKPGKSGGKNSIVLADSQGLFSGYFYAFKEELEYSAYLNLGLSTKSDDFLTNRSNKPVGFMRKFREGLIVCLPTPNYANSNPKLIAVLIECAKKYFSKHEVTPPPSWISEFALHGEDEFDFKVQKLNARLKDISDKKQDLESEKKSITKFKALLFEQGPELEAIVIDAFRVLGFKADNRKFDDIEHDIVFECPEGKGIAEVEGRDNNSIHIGKLDQLIRAVDEDFDLNGKYAQGLLIGNHYRLIKPEDRKAPFTEKVLTVAKKKDFGLITTAEIFYAISKVLEHPEDENYKTFCRQTILITTGAIIKLIQSEG